MDGMFQLVAIFVIMGAIMYFFMIRPARKQQRKQQDMMSALEVGSRVMLGSGIYATVRHLGEKQAVVEISPGVDLTILRAAIRTVVTPEEEEFEYSDEISTSVEDQVANVDMDALEADVASAFAPPESSEETLDEAEDSDTDTKK